MKTKVGVFFGGKSVEHEVSVISGIQAIKNMDKDKYDVVPIYLSKEGVFYTGEALLDVKTYKNLEELSKKATQITITKDVAKDKIFLYKYPFSMFKSSVDYIDIAFPVMHGSTGENGSMQGYFEMLDIPYVGCDVTSSAIGMDKIITKHVLKTIGIPVIEYYSFYSCEWIVNEQTIVEDIENKLGYPLIVKPATGGSSIGITKVSNRVELEQGIELARTMSEKVLVEKLIENMREINCSVLGDAEKAVASVCEEPIGSKDFLTFEDKYMNNSTKGMSSAKRKIPADLSEEMTKKIQDMSVKVFKDIGCTGVIRIDYIIDTDNEQVYLNELNTIPGSLAFYLWKEQNKEYKELLDDLISLALRRHKSRTELTYSYTNNLFAQGNIDGIKK